MVKNILRRGSHFTKLQKFKHHDFIFKVSTPPRHKLLHMGILAQILENLTNFYFGSDFANCTNFMWSKTSLEEGHISQKLQKFKHHDFIFKVSTHPPGINSCTWVTMWSKTSLEEGPISQKLRENAHFIFHRPWYLGPSTLPILYYFVFDVYFVTLMNGSLII